MELQMPNFASCMSNIWSSFFQDKVNPNNREPKKKMYIDNRTGELRERDYDNDELRRLENANTTFDPYKRY